MLVTNPFDSALNFDSNKLHFWRHNVLVFCCAANKYNKITGIFFFKDFKTEVSALSINEAKITAENPFNRDQLGIKGNYESQNEDETFL